MGVDGCISSINRMMVMIGSMNIRAMFAPESLNIDVQDWVLEEAVNFLLK